MRRLAFLASIVMLSAGVALSAQGGQGKGKGKQNQSSPVYGVGLEMVNDVNGDGVPNHGDSVKFVVNTPATSYFISLNCHQGSTWVLAAGGYPSTFAFTLSADSWTSGAADCSAAVYTTVDGSKTTTLGTLTFQVGA